MSNKLVDAFNTIIKLQGRSGTIERYGEFAAIDIKFAPANYVRNLSAVEETTITGREFVIPLTSLEGTDYNPPKKGDIVTDAQLGEDTLIYVEDLIILGSVAGWRVRTG